MYTHTHSHTHTHTRTRTRTRTHTCMHKCTPTGMHERAPSAHTHARMHAHTHTHTYVQFNSNVKLYILCCKQHIIKVNIIISIIVTIYGDNVDTFLNENDNLSTSSNVQIIVFTKIQNAQTFTHGNIAVEC